MTSKFFYDRARPSTFSTLQKLRAAVRGPPEYVRSWLEKQDAYIFQMQVRKRLPRNPYSVNNVMDVRGCDLGDVRVLGRFNNNYKYILSVTDVFSKYLHMVPLKSKTGASVASACESFLQDPIFSKSRLRRPVWVRKDRARSF